MYIPCLKVQITQESSVLFVNNWKMLCLEIDFDRSARFFYSLVLPLKDIKIKHPFGIIQSNTQILQDLIGYFHLKQVLLGQPNMLIPFLILTK